MAVHVDNGPALQLRGLEVLSLPLKELAERKCLLLEPPGAFIMREEVRQFVAEDGHAARLKPDYRCARVDFRLQRVQYLAQEPFGGVEHPEIIERAPAAQRPIGDDDLVASRFEHLDCRLKWSRVQVVIEGIGPDDHPWRAHVA